MVVVKKRILITINTVSSSNIDVSKIITGDAILSSVLRLPPNQLPNAFDFKGKGKYKGGIGGYGGEGGYVGPRDVGFPIQVNSGAPVTDTGGTGTGTGTGTGGDTGNPADALGRITLVQAPTFTTSGGQFQIKIHVRNDGTGTAKFQARVEITSLGIVNEPTAGVVLKPNESGVINKTMIMPESAEHKLYPAKIELLKVIDVATGDIVKEDEEIATIPGPNVVVPPTPTPTPTPNPTCIIRNGFEYCKSNNYQPGCIVEDGVVYCPTYTQPPIQCPDGTEYDQATNTCKPKQCPTGYTLINGVCVKDQPTPTPEPPPTPYPQPQAYITMSSYVEDGRSFKVRGYNFLRGEIVDINLEITWESSRSRYNGRKYTLHRWERAGYHGTFSEYMKTEEVPSRVRGTAHIIAVGRTSGRTATGSIRVL